MILDVRCVSNPGEPCVETHRVERGGTVRVSGRNLGRAAQLLFYGSKGERDDASAPVSAAAPGSALAAVPASARSGPVAVLDASGRRSLRWTGLVLDDPLQDFGTYQPLGAPSPVRVAVSKPRRIYYGGAQKAVFTYDVIGAGAMDLQVNLVRSSDGKIVQSWDRPGSAPGAHNRVIWNGSVGGRVPPDGRYAFRVSALGASTAGLRTAPSAPDDESVSLYGHVFPVRGSHDFGGAGAHFGAGRSGHSHQGQDVFAECGTPLVAARAGKVKFSGFHAAAGYYVVIDGKGTDVDYAYMHLRQRAAVQVGDCGLHRPGPGRGRRDRQRRGMPPALRGMVSPRLVRRRAPLRSAAGPDALGPDELAAAPNRRRSEVRHLGARRLAGCQASKTG